MRTFYALVIAFALGLARAVTANALTLQWDPVTENVKSPPEITAIEGYQILWGTQSGGSNCVYPNSDFVWWGTSYSFPNNALAPSTFYYSSVKAINVTNLYSNCSSEL